MAALNYDNLTLAEAEEMSFEEWQKVPQKVVNRLMQEMTGKPDLFAEQISAKAAAAGRIGGQKRWKKKRTS